MKNKNKNLELNALLIASKHLIDQYITLEALKDSTEISKTKAQQAIWDCLNILGKTEIDLEKEITKEAK